MAVRPLTLLELSAIIEPTIEPPTGFTREDVTKNQVSYCGYFLTVKGSEVNLIHQSAKDYLLSGDHDSTPELRDFRMDEKAGNQEIAHNCFQYLEDSFLPSRSIDSMGETSHLEAFPLLSYATRYWHIHARSLPRSDDIFDLSRPFYRKNSRIRELWLKTYGDLEKVPYILFTNKSTLLHIASHFGILPLAEKLLKGFMNMAKRFRSINQKDANEKTALHWAATGGHLAIARLLLEKDADVNAKDRYNETPLYGAAVSKNEGLIRLLLKKGADVNAKTKWLDATPLHMAVNAQNEGIVRLILEHGARINAKGDIDGETALHAATKLGDKGLVRLLLEKGADVNAKDDDGRTALHDAAGFGYPFGQEGVIRLLLERGADINAKDKYGRTALDYAASSRDERIVQLLPEKGGDINARDYNNETALHRAAISAREGTVRLLLEDGADINAGDLLGQTALDNACSYERVEVVRLLLEKGADITAKDDSGMTALEYAYKKKREKVVQLLLGMGGVSNHAAPSSEWDIESCDSID